MIKVYCDKCGKEIVDNANYISNNIEIRDGHHIIMTFPGKALCLCNECRYNGLTCGFKVGDEVITSTGKIGKITNICNCDQCEERGFYEPTVETEIGDVIYITDNDKRVNFRSFYKIGDHIYGNIDEDVLLDQIESANQQLVELREQITDYYVQLNVIRGLKK